MNVLVPSLSPGAGSLPAELRIRRGDIDPVSGRERLLMGQRGMGSVGDISCDADGVCTASDPNVSQIPTESPYPVVFSSDAPTVPIDYNKLITSGLLSLAQLTAIQQGGSVKTANGTIYGSSAASVVAAGNPGAALNITGGSMSAILTNPLLWAAVGLVAFSVMRGRR